MYETLYKPKKKIRCIKYIIILNMKILKQLNIK